jgi:hypothetical protein
MKSIDAPAAAPLLEELMSRQGAALPETLPPEAAREHALAASRCVACQARRLCVEALRAGRADRHGLFCPNAHYVAWVRHNALRFA